MSDASRDALPAVHDPDQPISPPPGVVAVALAAGQGTRLGANQNKVLLPVLGKPVLLYAVEALSAVPEVDGILVVVQASEIETVAGIMTDARRQGKLLGVIPGGSSRHGSEQCALDHLRPQIAAGAIQVIMIHDGARPFIDPRDVADLVQVARAGEGAVLAAPVLDDEVVARLRADSAVVQIFAPGELWRAQTPQAFPATPLLAAYDAARRDSFVGTDTSAAFERMGYPVRVVAARGPNFKITLPGDLEHAAFLARRLIAHPS